MDNKPKTVDRLELLKLLPIGQYEYVDATFTAADTDTVITYSIIRPENPENVRWFDVTPHTGRVYRALAPNRTSWGQNYVILRSTVVGPTRLMLFLERE
jgi:hypothetical protein